MQLRVKHLTLFFGCVLVVAASQAVKAEGSDAAMAKVRQAAADCSYLWKSGGCRWVEKHYDGLSPDFMKAVESGGFAHQLPLSERPSTESRNPYEDIWTYLDRFLSPTYSGVKEAAFNEEGWKVEEYADTSRLSPVPSQVTYLNPGLPIQGRKTVIQVGDKQWTRGAIGADFKLEEGVQPSGAKKIPLALADLFPMLFVENVFVDVAGRSVVVEEKSEGSFQFTVSQNEGVTTLNLKKSKGALVMPDQKTLVNGKLMKLGGEFGAVKVTGNPPVPNASVPRFTIDLTLVDNGTKLNVVTREVLGYDCMEISSDDLIAPIAAARKK